MVMVKEFPDWWFVLISLGGIGATTYVLIAWKLHQYRELRLVQIHATSGDPWHFSLR